MEIRRQRITAEIEQVMDCAPTGIRRNLNLLPLEISRNLTDHPLFQLQLRTTDHIARFKRNQFLIFFGQVAQSDSQVVADRCAEAVARLNFLRNPNPLTLSLGMTESVPGDTTARMLAQAELSLRQAQSEGGDYRRVMLQE
jgi:hypothetical protein